MDHFEDDFVCSPAVKLGSIDKGYKGGPGDYDGEPGWPMRTSSPNAVPEKVYDNALPGVKPDEPGNDGEQIRRSDENVGSSKHSRTLYSGY